MTGRNRTVWGRALRRSAVYLFLVPCSLFLGAVRAQPPAPAVPGSTTLVYTWQTAFKLPVKIDEAERSRLAEIQLFVRAGAGGPWVCQEVAPPAQREFLFRVPADGEYDFTMVLVEPTGRRTPADVTRETPELIVVVDTQPPECDLQLVTGANNELLL